MTSHPPAQRFSHRAREVLDTAHDLARREPGVEPHSGHLLVALARAGGPLIEDTLLTLGTGYEDIVAAVAATPAPADAKHDFNDALSAAGRVTETAGQIFISAVSLAGGLFADTGSTAAMALAQTGVTPNAWDAALWAARDMLVPLLTLPDPTSLVERVQAAGVRVRRARAWEAPRLAAFIESQGFSPTWTPEAANAFSRRPIAVFLAERGDALAGFAAYDCGRLGIFGPTGVSRAERAGGVASTLLLRTMVDMRTAGYVYAIIGAVGPAEFYERVCAAVLLPSAWPSYVTSMD